MSLIIQIRTRTGGVLENITVGENDPIDVLLRAIQQIGALHAGDIFEVMDEEDD